MTQALFHRGPDGSGTWTSATKELSLGHRRLAILDLSDRAAQPMVRKNGKRVLSYNGEIYNFREIRRELEKEGVVFASESDTEVLLHVLERWGLAGVNKLNGMWAFAYYDGDREELWLSRDRAGVKPMYYHSGSQGFFFGSEVKALLASGCVRAAVDLDGLNEYFTFQNVISDRTLFAGVRMLPPGCHGVLSLRTGEFRVQKYWDFDFTPDIRLSEQDAISEFRREFDAAIDRHLLSDVPVGATISGGMDSSAIVATAIKKVPDLSTFTGWFDTSANNAMDRSVSERADAALVSKTFSTRHFERQISWQDQIDSMAQIVWHLEDPKVGMCYTFFQISNLVSQNVTVNLSGTGGDEVFAGYPWRYALIENCGAHGEFEESYFRYWCRVLGEHEKAEFFSESAWMGMDRQGPRNAFDVLTASTRGLSSVSRALYFDAKTFLHGMLMVEDKLGMAFSTEARFPFLDKHLIEVAQRIPDKLKYKDGLGKYVFRKTFEGMLPDQILKKRKQGFTPPDLTWYRNELHGWIRSMLLGHRTQCHEWIRPAAIERVLQRHLAGEDMRFQIWNLLFFEGWCRTFLAGSSTPQFRTW